MNPSGLMNCMSIRKAPLDKKQEELNEYIYDIRELHRLFNGVDRYSVPEEIKKSMRESLEKELREIKNAMYDIIESITLPQIELTKEDKGNEP
jgi:hypothetical protein